MSKPIPYSQWEQYVPSGNGDFVRVNHESPECSGDSKSMKVWRTEDGDARASCYRCGGYGYRASNPREAAQRRKDRARSNQDGGDWSDESSNKVQLPTDSSSDVRTWSGGAQRLVRQYGITDREVREYDIRYCKRTDSIYLPVYRDGGLVGFQIRCLDATQNKPKYVSIVKKGQWNEHYFVPHFPTDADVLVVVEDMLSAIKVGRQYPAIALLGTELKSMSFLLKYPKYLIWLDNDNTIVKVKQAKIKARLDLFGECVILKTPLDPKAYTDEEIRQWLQPYQT